MFRYVLTKLEASGLILRADLSFMEQLYKKTKRSENNEYSYNSMIAVIIIDCHSAVAGVFFLTGCFFLVISSYNLPAKTF